MTSNFFPDNVIANEGCFYWGWFPPCEVQIMILLPWVIWLIIRLKNAKA
jgi:hypothetical protein